MGPSNQMVLRNSICPSTTPFGLSRDGRRNIRGMNISRFKIPTTENSSPTLERGLRQWLLVNRNATDTNGAALVTMKIKEKTAM